MNKLNRIVVTAVVLVTAFVLVSRQSAADPHGNRNFPLIVAKGRFRNQIAPIDNTTIFTPSQTGLYRFSGYVVETVGTQAVRPFGRSIFPGQMMRAWKTRPCSYHLSLGVMAAWSVKGFR